MDAKEVAKHTTRESCWVIIHGVVYDVTDFLDSHPGGSKIILKLAGADATSEYDPVHPPGTLEETLKPAQILGPIDPTTLPPPPSPPSSSSSLPPTAAPLLPPLDAQLNIDDFATTAEKVLSPKAWAYYSSAADDLSTKIHNNKAYRQILLRPRIFRNVRDVSTHTTLCGSASTLPVFIAPAAMARLAHPSGEAGIAAACGSLGIVQCVSNNASLRPEQIAAARVSAAQPLWFQLYVQIERGRSEALLQRVNALGFTAIVLTLDAPAPGKREADERAKNTGETTSDMSGEGVTGGAAVKGGGLGRALFAGTSPSLTWEDLKWLRSQTHLPIILKGIQTHEDAALAASKECADLGVTGIILSNHGGRAADTAPPPVYTLLEIRKYAPFVLERLEVYVDGGIRRGTDVVKALCLGATAVGIGRPALYGLSGYGPEGVERVLTILREEIETTMRLLGVNSIKELGPRYINTRALDGLIYQEPVEVDKMVKAKL